MLNINDQVYTTHSIHTRQKGKEKEVAHLFCVCIIIIIIIIIILWLNNYPGLIFDANHSDLPLFEDDVDDELGGCKDYIKKKQNTVACKAYIS